MNRKPTALKMIEGNRGKRPLPKNEPKPRPVDPDPIAGLTPAEKKAYKKLCKSLTRVGLVTELDGDVLSILVKLRTQLQFCWKIQQGLKKDLTKAIKEKDPVVADLRQRELKFWLNEERRYALLFRQTANDFGLSPRGRVGLTISSATKSAGEDLLT